MKEDEDTYFEMLSSSKLLKNFESIKTSFERQPYKSPELNCQRLKFFGKRLHYIMHALLKATVKFWCVLLPSFFK